MNANPNDRAGYIAGLHELADFLADHPAVPCPSIGRIILHRLPNVVGFLDGLDEGARGARTARTGAGDRHYVDVARTFAGLTFEAMTDADHVGHSVEVPSTTVEFHPLSPAHIRAALAQVSEGGERHRRYCPLRHPCDPLPVPVEAVTAP